MSSFCFTFFFVSVCWFLVTVSHVGGFLPSGGAWMLVLMKNEPGWGCWLSWVPWWGWVLTMALGNTWLFQSFFFGAGQYLQRRVLQPTTLGRLGVVRAWLQCAEGQVERRSLEGGGVSYHSFNSPSSPVPHPHTLQGLEASPSLEWDLQFPARVCPGEEDTWVAPYANFLKLAFLPLLSPSTMCWALRRLDLSGVLWCESYFPLLASSSAGTEVPSISFHLTICFSSSKLCGYLP